MKAVQLSLPIVILTLMGNLSQVSAAEVSNPEFLQLLAKRVAQLGAVVNEGRSELGASISGSPVEGLRTSALATGALDPAIGLGSTARGLTPLATWQQIFPRKKQR